MVQLEIAKNIAYLAKLRARQHQSAQNGALGNTCQYNFVCTATSTNTTILSL